MATKKKAATEKAAGRSPAEIGIKVQVQTPDGKSHEQEFTIVNAHACLLASQINNAESFISLVKDGLTARFGINYVK